MRLSALSRASCMTRLPLLCVSLLLTACASSPTRLSEPTPPRVACSEHVPAGLLPPIPDPLTLDAAQVWMAQAIGVYEIEVTRRATTARCLDALRQTGTIR